MGKPLALIVEDEKDISVIFAKALHAAGFETEVAHSGDEAIIWLSSNTPNVVVLDLHMPSVLGKDLLIYFPIGFRRRVEKIQRRKFVVFFLLLDQLPDGRSVSNLVRALGDEGSPTCL